MIQIKNLRGGWLFIPDAGLKLRAGQVASVEKLTPQIEGLIKRGYVSRVVSETQANIPSQKEDALPIAKGKSDQSTKINAVDADLPPVPDEYNAMNAHESVVFIKKCEDLPVLRAILKKEVRKTVLDDLEARIKELESLTK